MRYRRALIPSLVAVLALSLPHFAYADDVADEAELQFQLGAENYQKGDLREALTHFLASNRLAPNRNVQFNIGRTYENLNRFPDAYRFYSLAIESGDAAWQAKVLDSIHSIAGKVAILDIETSPPGATIYLQRRDLGARGVSPRSLGLDSGTYTIIAELPGYHTETSAPMTVSIGQRYPLHLALRPILGSVRVQGAAVGADVRVDSESAPVACQVPCLTDLPPGRHTLYLSKAGYQVTATTINVAPGETQILSPTPRALTGAVLINTDVRDAYVQIDGHPAGFTPTVANVALGDHTVRISREGYATLEKHITVDVSEQATFSFELERVDEVQAASRKVERVEDAAASVTIISSDELRAMGYATVPDALQGVRGFYNLDDGTWADLGVRGFLRAGDYANRVLLLLDGHPVIGNYGGSGVLGFEGRTDLDDIERIEIVRGPGSVYYGTNAFFAVINLVSRRRSAPTHVEAAAGVVKNNVGHGRATAQVRFGENGGIWLSAAGATSTGDNYNWTELASTPYHPDGTANGGGYMTAETAQGRLWWKDLTVQWFVNVHWKGVPSGVWRTQWWTGQTMFRDSRAFAEAKYEPKLSDTLRLVLRAHWNLQGLLIRYDLNDDVNDFGRGNETYHGQWVGIEPRLIWDPSPKFSASAGVEGQYDYQMQMNVNNQIGGMIEDVSKPYTIFAAYGNAEWRPADAVKFVGGVRGDYYSQVGGTVNPRFAVILNPYKNGVLKVMAGSAFRAPSNFETNYNAGIIQPSPSGPPSPEKVYTGEFEFTHKLNPLTSLVVAGFANYVTNLIDLVPSNRELGGFPILNYVNSTSPELAIGGELEVRREWRDGWMLAANYSHQHREYVQTPSIHVANSPEDLGALKAAVPILGRTLRWMTRVTVVGPQWDRNEGNALEAAPQGQSNPVGLLDVMLSGESEKYGLRYNLGLYNAFDYRYSLPVDGLFTQRMIPQGGRQVYAQAQLTF